MSTADLNALLAQVVRAAGEAKCPNTESGEHHTAWPYGVGRALCPDCGGSNRTPLAQAVWEGMSTECPCIKATVMEACDLCHGYVDVKHHSKCQHCNGSQRVPLTIPEGWPEQWANDAVCGGLEGIPRTVKGEVSLETDALLVKAYTLVLHGNAPGALRALEAAVEKEAGK